jgi:RNA polymerase sigma-70 factor (ECF subfamily)
MNKRSNESWLADLRAGGDVQAAALEDLRATLMGGLPYALSGWLSREDPAFTALAEEVTQEALLKILDNLHTFEGRSQFTTWAHKIAVNLALSKLRRRRWTDVSLEELTGENDSGPAHPWLVADSSAGPAQKAEQRDMLERINRIIAEELTEKQRRALVARLVYGMPADRLAEEMHMERNALYKLIFDARENLKRHLQAEGLDPQEVLAAFEG